MVEVLLANSVLCDTVCTNSWVSFSPSNGLAVHGTASKVTVKGINTDGVIDRKLV